MKQAANRWGSSRVRQALPSIGGRYNSTAGEWAALFVVSA